MQIKVDTIIVGAWAVNTYLIRRESDHHCLLIDPGDEGEIIKQKIKADNLIPTAILLTHAHPDHIGALDFLATSFQVPTYLHAGEQEMLAYAPALSMLLGLGGLKLPSDIIYIDTQPSLIVDDFEVEVLLTPGHTPGSVCYRLGDCLFTGDTLFQNSVGRVDLPGGSFDQLRKSLSLLKQLPDQLQVYPGHGAATTLGDEKKNNPYLLELGA